MLKILTILCFILVCCYNFLQEVTPSTSGISMHDLVTDIPPTKTISFDKLNFVKTLVGGIVCFYLFSYFILAFVNPLRLSIFFHYPLILLGHTLYFAIVIDSFDDLVLNVLCLGWDWLLVVVSWNLISTAFMIPKSILKTQGVCADGIYLGNAVMGGSSLMRWDIMGSLASLTKVANCSAIIFYINILLIPSLITLNYALSIILYSYGLFVPDTPTWVCSLMIYLSNDVEVNPGDPRNNYFSFCNWNINSISKDDFARVNLIEAHNSLHSYDLISFL